MLQYLVLGFCPLGCTEAPLDRFWHPRPPAAQNLHVPHIHTLSPAKVMAYLQWMSAQPTQTRQKGLVLAGPLTTLLTTCTSAQGTSAAKPLAMTNGQISLTTESSHRSTCGLQSVLLGCHFFCGLTSFDFFCNCKLCGWASQIATSDIFNHLLFTERKIVVHWLPCCWLFVEHLAWFFQFFVLPVWALFDATMSMLLEHKRVKCSSKFASKVLWWLL